MGSNVVDMRSMFFNSYFNQPIGSWSVSKVERMDYMLFRSGAPVFKTTEDYYAVDGGAVLSSSPFNQCLSDWADRVPTNANLTQMLYGTGCVDKNPIVGNAPWCQSVDDGCAAATPVPSVDDECTDDPNWRGGNQNQKCVKFLEKEKPKKCSKNKDGVRDACPEQCSPKKELCKCKDAKKVKIKKNNNKTKTVDCKKIKEKGWCGKKDKYGVSCRKLCPNKCDNTAACIGNGNNNNKRTTLVV